MPTSARPAPAYIAASVASQIVTDHHNAQLRDDHDPDQDGDAPDPLTNAIFSEPALNLLNGFLDYLLFAFLSTARSPSLAAIRPAIVEVLKPRLAREATATADDELQGLLGGEDEEEFPEHLGQPAGVWDVEKAWKRTRLRIMVYTRLGELEDEDEERYVQQERGLSMDEGDDDEAGLVSWASAIFLTSVIEYVAEQTLLVSGQASFGRILSKLRKQAQKADDGEEHQLERIVVEDFDVEKIALSSALGRLWRTWRKRARSPTLPLNSSRGPRPTASFASLHHRQVSHDTIDTFIMGADVPELPEHRPTETEIAANIPLPMSDNDVNEIEVPGLAPEMDDEEGSGTATPVARSLRPASVMALSPADNLRRKTAKDRPVSMPPPASQPFTVPAQADESESPDDEEMNFITPMERASDDDSYLMDEPQEGFREQDVSDAEPDADMVAFAASTGMGFGMSPASPSKSGAFDREGDDDIIHTPTKTGFAEPQVYQSKRMSIEKTGPPGIVRTYSSRSRSSPMPTPELKPAPEDGHLDDLSSPGAIGVARTSNVPIPTPSPPAELAANEQSDYIQQKQPDHQGFVELAPRHVATTASMAAAQKAPSFESRPVTQQKSVQRKEISQQKAPQRRDATPPRTRGPALAALPETEDWTNSPPNTSSTRPAHRSSPANNSPKSSPKPSGLTRARDVPVALPERPVKRPSAEGSSPLKNGSGDGFIAEKATLKRVSSSSSTARSVSTSILHTGRDSDVSLRPRGLSGRMSEEDRQREFEALVKSEDTVKFTLTPQGMRDMDVSRIEVCLIYLF